MFCCVYTAFCLFIHPLVGPGSFCFLAMPLLVNLFMAPICLGVKFLPQLNLVVEAISRPGLFLPFSPASSSDYCPSIQDALATLDSLEARKPVPSCCWFFLALWTHQHAVLGWLGCGPPSLDKLFPPNLGPSTLYHPFLCTSYFVPEPCVLFLERGPFYG